MTFGWLKRYVPRGIYARAFLILVAPVVVLQLVVSVVFIQRHFEGVTEQLSGQLARQVNAALATERRWLPDMLDLSQVSVTAEEVPARDLRRWWDFSGRVVIRELRETIPGLRRVILPTDQEAILYVQRGGDTFRFSFDRDRVSASNPHQLLVNMVVFGALMTAIAYLYLRNQLRPITRLAQAAEAFGRGRNVPYSPSGATEVRSAGAAFLDMRNRIERQIEQRTLMLSGISHDLRTPLTRLRLGLSMLDEEDAGPLLRDVDDMQRLVDAFLEFARDNAASGQAEPTDPVTLVRAVVADSEREGHVVTLAFVEGDGTVPLRPVAIRRAMENLIGNAVRYGSRAEVSVRLSDKSLRIRIEDDGPGIAPDRREDALRPFVRLDPARNQDRGTGVGLGLAIAADIARAHGGVLRLGESERLGGLRADIVIAR
ncbi:ATP-binding protein [Roseivivax sediminis]|uniref:histidine kinase n=1 Tax=Roseivivax sediminis TaxID=936889 RepID=A0A1I1X814_9RHOB|nr:ATP-binding protein [Roseivivax sediminis]SFE03556.1 two-component system, OmpR family, osmolarity sensor histidine kinase EnvZ [Roseivivax sediminis]